jgi:alkanesulfonate monooxygenase SsuD/methylene tetrahydromethanopterin reductase-like flavin-dependent oxidoreductase (luciferase family)
VNDPSARPICRGSRPRRRRLGRRWRWLPVPLRRPGAGTGIRGKYLLLPRQWSRYGDSPAILLAESDAILLDFHPGLAANPPADAPALVVERVLRRVALLADGWLTFAVSPELLALRRRLLRELAAAAGRPLPPDFPVCVYLNVNVDDDAGRALSDAVATWQGETARTITPGLVRAVAAVGPAGHCAQRLAALAAAGATDIMVGLLSAHPKRQLSRITEQLLPLVTDR